MYVLTITINQPTSSIHFLCICVSYLYVTVDIDNVDIVVSLNFGLLWCCVKTKDIKSINPVE